jgi:hypothetical protein
MSDEELLTISSRLCHFLMHKYILPHGVYHIPDGHMAQFPAKLSSGNWFIGLCLDT